MEARATLPYPVTAFTGREYVAYEWRPVPAGSEAEASKHPYLEIRSVSEEAEQAQAAGVDTEPLTVDATPAAVKLAETHGLDLGTVTGTGAGGRILLSDVEAAVNET